MSPSARVFHTVQIDRKGIRSERKLVAVLNHGSNILAAMLAGLEGVQYAAAEAMWDVLSEKARAGTVWLDLCILLPV